MLKLTLFLFAQVVLVITGVTRQGLFQKVINQLSFSQKCFSNYALVSGYISLLRNNSLEVFDARHLKNQMNNFLDKLDYQKSVEGIEQKYPVYNICKTQKKDMLREPLNNKTNVNVSITKMLQRYPYLIPNLRPQKMIQFFQILDAQTRTDMYFVQYLIKNNTLYIKQTRQGQLQHENILVFFIPKVLHFLPNMYFYHVARDEFPTSILKNWISRKTDNHQRYDGLYQFYKKSMIQFPLFMRSIDLGGQIEFNKFILPDTYVLSDRWQPKLDQAIKSSSQISWQNKKNVIFFIGALTGSVYTDEDHYSNLSKYHPRLYALNFSSAYPDIMDFRYTNGLSLSQQQLKQKNLTIKKSDFMHFTNQLKNKYILSIDGFTAAWQRVPMILMSNSLLIKQQSLRVQWFYDEMIPDVHYVSVKPDLSDLVEKFNYLNKNPQITQNIIKTANQYSKRFSVKQIYMDLVSILKQFASYQQLTQIQAQHLLKTRNFIFSTQRKQSYVGTLLDQQYNNIKTQTFKYWWTPLAIIISIIIVGLMLMFAIRFKNRNKQNVFSQTDIQLQSSINKNENIKFQRANYQNKI